VTERNIFSLTKLWYLMLVT